MNMSEYADVVVRTEENARAPATPVTINVHTHTLRRKVSFIESENIYRFDVIIIFIYVSSVEAHEKNVWCLQKIRIDIGTSASRIYIHMC